MVWFGVCICDFRFLKVGVVGRGWFASGCGFAGVGLVLSWAVAVVWSAGCDCILVLVAGLFEVLCFAFTFRQLVVFGGWLGMFVFVVVV